MGAAARKNVFRAVQDQTRRQLLLDIANAYANVPMWRRLVWAFQGRFF